MKCRGVGVLVGADRDASFTAEKALNHNWFLQARTPWTWIMENMESDFHIFQYISYQINSDSGSSTWDRLSDARGPSAISFQEGWGAKAESKASKKYLGEVVSVTVCAADLTAARSKAQRGQRHERHQRHRFQMQGQRCRCKEKVERGQKWKSEGPLDLQKQKGRFLEDTRQTFGFLHASVAALMMQNEYVLCVFCQAPVVSFNALMVKLIQLLDWWQNLSWGESSSVKEKGKNSEKLRWWNEDWQDDSKSWRFDMFRQGKYFSASQCQLLRWNCFTLLLLSFPRKRAKQIRSKDRVLAYAYWNLETHIRKCICIWHMY